MFYSSKMLIQIICTIQDKSADVRKAAEACISELIRACGQEMVCHSHGFPVMDLNKIPIFVFLILGKGFNYLFNFYF